MKSIVPKKNQVHVDILLPLPREVIEDLIKIAAFNNSSLEDLIYGYVVDGLASDSRIVKQMEFSDNEGTNWGTKSIHSMTAREILNTFNLAC